jgi:hypothetical protein
MVISTLGLQAPGESMMRCMTVTEQLARFPNGDALESQLLPYPSLSGKFLPRQYFGFGWNLGVAGRPS